MAKKNQLSTTVHPNSPKNITIDFQVNRQNDRGFFTIKYRGIGISGEEQKNLFQSCQRASNVKHIPGTGLGLMIAKKCVELHQGEIRVESELDAGVVLNLDFPSSDCLFWFVIRFLGKITNDRSNIDSSAFSQDRAKAESLCP